jgi:hypothetical protein
MRTNNGIDITVHTFIDSKKETPWPQLASEVYRPCDRHLSAKLVPTFADRGVSCNQRV